MKTNNQKIVKSAPKPKPKMPPRASNGKGALPQRSVAAAYSSGQSTMAPKISATRDSCRITHRELIANVSGSVAFATPLQFALNPGMSTSFPWLSIMAQAWEEYHFTKLRFCYYTRTGSNTPGSALLIPDYDAADSAPTSEFTAAAFEDVAEDVPWKDINCTLREGAMHGAGPRKFIRSGPLAANLDIKTYDAGSLFVGTVDGTAVAWGKLWVEYDVTFYTPQLPASGGMTVAAQVIQSVTAATAGNFGVPVPAADAGSMALVTIVGNVITFAQAGKYFVQYNAFSATSTTQTAPPALSAGSVFITTMLNGAGSVVAGNGSVAFAQTLVANVLSGATLTFTNTIVGVTGTQLSVSLLPLNLV